MSRSYDLPTNGDALERILALSLDLGYKFTITINNGVASLIVNPAILHTGDTNEAITENDNPHTFCQEIEALIESQTAPDHRQAGPGPGNASGCAA